MTDYTPKPQKQLVMVAKTGPSFNPSEVSEAHAQLDIAGAPRTDDFGRVMNLADRIYWLHKAALKMACDLVQHGL